MSEYKSSSSVKVDVANPGQFFACCGLLELAHQLWPGAEGWFDLSTSMFAILPGEKSGTIEQLKNGLLKCELSGLSETELQEREHLEGESRLLKKLKKKLPEDKEGRRKELGVSARKGEIRLSEPFNLFLNWWQTNDEDARTPKTWSGLQELHKIARAAQDALSNITEPTELLDYSCVLHIPKEYRKKDADEKKIEPFYFDARRFVHPLDTGFSLDVQGAQTIAHPAVELLALIGLQRFRPTPTERKGTFQYSIWLSLLCAAVAAAVVCGAVPATHRYQFSLLVRDDQKRYKAFDFATPIGGKHER